jgi:hypothetical protein
VAITAVDSVIRDVVLVAERDRLIYGSADFRDIGRADIELENHEQNSESHK